MVEICSAVRAGNATGSDESLSTVVMCFAAPWHRGPTWETQVFGNSSFVDYEWCSVLVLAWICAAALWLKSLGDFISFHWRSQQLKKPDSSWQHFTDQSAVITASRIWPVAVLMFLYPFRKESFVPCLTGPQICKGWNLSKGSSQTKGELLNSKTEALTRLKGKHTKSLVPGTWHLTGGVLSSTVQDWVRNYNLDEAEGQISVEQTQPGVHFVQLSGALGE